MMLLRRRREPPPPYIDFARLVRACATRHLPEVPHRGWWTGSVDVVEQRARMTRLTSLP